MKNYFKSYDFKRGLLLSFTVLVSGLIFYFFDFINHLPATVIGLLLTSFCDIQGDLYKRIVGMSLSILLNVINFVLVVTFKDSTPLFFGYLGIVIFSLSYLGVYGNRAAMLAFSGIMGIILSMTRDYQGLEITDHVLYYALGGIIYIGISTLFHTLTKRSQVNEKLHELLEDTTQYLILKVNRYKNNISFDENKRLQQHQRITQSQEALRELLFSRDFSIHSSKVRERQVLALIELIDIAELASANPVDLAYLKTKKDYPEYLFDQFYALLCRQVDWLNLMSQNIRGKNNFVQPLVEKAEITNFKNEIDDYAIQNGISAVRHFTLILLNFQKYLWEQQKRLEALNHVINNQNTATTRELMQDQQQHFLNQEKYSFHTLQNHFNLSSPLMRHSIRLTVAMVIGYGFGLAIGVSNPYWIMLTIAVIMRPSYGLTKQRSIQRVLGTIVGVVVIAMVFLFTQNPLVFIVLALISMIFGFSLLNRNYFWAAFAITLNVVFAFALLQSDAWNVLEYRLIDTLIGAMVSVLIGFLVLPHWAYKTIHQNFIQVILSNQKYLQEIENQFYKKSSDVQYRLKRKQAFAATADLHESYQTYTQDPKNKQRKRDLYYEWMVLNQNILSVLASMGTYIKNHHLEQNHSFSESIQFFKIQFNQIQSKLQDKSIDLGLVDFHNPMHLELNQLINYRDQEILSGKLEISDKLRMQLTEAKHLQQEIEILHNLIEKLMNITNKF